MSTTRPAPGVRGPMGGMMGGAPAAKSKDFKGSLKRLLAVVGKERTAMYGVFALITAAVTISAFGPKIMGRATNQIFYGFLGRQIPAGVTKAQAVAGLRARGQGTLARMLDASGFVPGK